LIKSREIFNSFFVAVPCCIAKEGTNNGVAVRSHYIRPEGLAVAIWEVFVITRHVPERGEVVCAKCIAHPHGCMRIDGASRKVFSKTFHHPKRQVLKVV